MALALLAGDWAARQGGTVHAFIVDHGLRPESAHEATETAAALGRLGLPARILTLGALAAGPALAARARTARLAALEGACRDAGILDLLFGHQAADQAETVLMRQLRASGPAGLAAMSPIVETGRLRLLRPLLGVPPARLRATLIARRLLWAEDPSNVDARFTRARLRAARSDAGGTGPATRSLCAAAAAAAAARSARDQAAAAWLATAASLRPEGFALLPAGPWPAAALAGLLRMLGGARHIPPTAAVTAIAAAPEAAIGRGLCLGGVMLRPAGRLGPGFLLCREAAVMAPPVPALSDAIWDGRFRRPAGLPDLPGETVGALGQAARLVRDNSDLPAVVLQTLPAYFGKEGKLVAVPALCWPDAASTAARAALFHPLNPAAGAPFAAACPFCHAGNVRRT